MAMIKIDLRIEEKSVEELQEFVRDGEFGNISEAIRYCVRKQLQVMKSRSPPPLVKVEGPEGPGSDPCTA